MRNVTLRQLRVFAAAARHMNFSRTADELHLSQPAVSTQIKDFAALVGLPLSFVNIWHRGADWLLLYRHVKHGPVIQDTRTACIGHL